MEKKKRRNEEREQTGQWKMKGKEKEEIEVLKA